jgi:adenosylhomocysteine nucleosidase
VARVGFITGLVSEADCLAPLVDREHLRIAGIGPGAAERCARELIATGCDLIISFGIAGGLEPVATPGRIVVAHDVIDPDGRFFATDARFNETLLRSLPDAICGRIAGSEHILANAAAKATLRQRTGGIAVDMESHHIARCAADAGIGFAVVRAIVDPHHARIPDAALHAVDETGKPRIGRVIGRLACRPWDVIALLRLGGYSHSAHASLGRVAPIVVGCADRL